MPRMNKELQIHSLEEVLRSRGVNPDTVDLQALVDPSLHLDEQIRQLEDRGIIPPEQVPDTQSQIQDEERELLIGQAEMLDENRSDQAQVTDDAIKAETVFDPDTMTEDDFETWAEKPNQHDIEGVDWHGI